MSHLFAGTSGWSYATWKPDFYPAKLSPTKFLQHYASRLNTVEVNYTFRHSASEKALQNWLSVTPEGFQFSFKANQQITHIKRLKDAAPVAKEFVKSLRPVSQAGRLGFVLFQLPPFLQADVPLLSDFLDGLQESNLAFEFRHGSWFTADVFALLRKHDATLCVAESEKLETPDVVTSSQVYYRLRKSEYSAQEQKAIAKRIEGHLSQGRDVFVYCKHEDEPQGALLAEKLLQEFDKKSF